MSFLLYLICQLYEYQALCWGKMILGMILGRQNFYPIHVFYDQNYVLPMKV